MRKTVLIVLALSSIAARTRVVTDSQTRTLTAAQKASIEAILDATHCAPIDANEGADVCSGDENFKTATVVYRSRREADLKACARMPGRVTVPGGTYDEPEVFDVCTTVRLSRPQRIQVRDLLNAAVCTPVDALLGTNRCRVGRNPKRVRFRWTANNASTTVQAPVIVRNAVWSFDVSTPLPKSRRQPRERRRQTRDRPPVITGQPGG